MKIFKLTEDHIKLLSNMYIEFNGSCEFGSIGSDCKRPFGNSNVIDDMSYILEVDPDEIDLEHIYINELPIAMQIVFSTKSFVPGTYIADDYYNNWKLQ